MTFSNHWVPQCRAGRSGRAWDQRMLREPHKLYRVRIGDRRDRRELIRPETYPYARSQATTFKKYTMYRKCGWLGLLRLATRL